jgi:ribonuclease HII
MKWLVGVDEAGRGPLAGPVAVGVAVVPIDFDWAVLPGVGDSKALKPKDREAIFLLAGKLREAGVLNFKVSASSHTVIDREGIVFAVNQAMSRALASLKIEPMECLVLLDGALRAPSSFKRQRTIIKGDAIEKVIGLASILAKVTRDRHMVQIASKYPAYDFDIHKGYGTKKHRDLIIKHGLSNIHRRSFCRHIQT